MACLSGSHWTISSTVQKWLQELTSFRNSFVTIYMQYMYVQCEYTCINYDSKGIAHINCYALERTINFDLVDSVAAIQLQLCVIVAHYSIGWLWAICIVVYWYTIIHLELHYWPCAIGYDITMMQVLLVHWKNRVLSHPCIAKTSIKTHQTGQATNSELNPLTVFCTSTLTFWKNQVANEHVEAWSLALKEHPWKLIFHTKPQKGTLGHYKGALFQVEVAWRKGCDLIQVASRTSWCILINREPHFQWSSIHTRAHVDKDNTRTYTISQ